MFVAKRRVMTWLRTAGAALLVCVFGCDGDRCDQDEQCLSSHCYYGECGSTLVTVIERAIEGETEDDEYSYDDDYDIDELEPARPAVECRAHTCLYLDEDDCERSGCELLLFCGELGDFDCALRSSSE